MPRKDFTSDHAVPDINPDSPFSAITLTSYLFDARPWCEESLLAFVDSCRKFAAQAEPADPSTASGLQWRRKCSSGELTDAELRTVFSACFEIVIHRHLAGYRPGYRFAVHVAPDRLWSASGPKVQVESSGPEIDHSIIDDLRTLLGIAQHLADDKEACLHGAS